MPQKCYEQNKAKKREWLRKEREREMRLRERYKVQGRDKGQDPYPYAIDNDTLFKDL